MEPDQDCNACLRAGEKKLAEKYCIDCEEHLCRQCWTAHTKNKLTLHHSFIDVSLVSSLPVLLVQSDQVCDNHSNFRLDLVCAVDDKVCCRPCMLDNHRNCPVVLPIETAAAMVRSTEQSKGLSKESRFIQHALEKVIDFGHDNVQRVQKEEQTILESIFSVRAKFEATSYEVEQALTKQLLNAHQDNIDKIQKYKEEVTNMREAALIYRQEMDFIKTHASENKTFLLIERLRGDLQNDKDTMKDISSGVRNVKLLYRDTSDFTIASVGKILVCNKPCPVKYAPATQILSTQFEYIDPGNYEINISSDSVDKDDSDKGSVYEDIDKATKGLVKEPSYVSSLGPYLTLSPSDVELEGKIDSGTFGEVWKGKFRKKHEVAVKRFKTGSNNIRIHQLLETNDDNIVKFYGAFSDKQMQCLVFEFMSQLDLVTYLKLEEGQNLQETELLSIASQVARGLSHLESKQIVHSRLQGKQILVGENGEVKVAGLEYATLDKVVTLYQYTAMNNDELTFEKNDVIKVIGRQDLNWWEGEMNGKRGFFPENYVTQPQQYIELDKDLLKWYSLETLQSGRIDVRSNVWSFGIIVMEIFTYGQTPYPDLQTSDVISRVRHGYRHPKPTGCSEDLYRIIMKCWDALPENRPTFENLFNSLEDLVFGF